MKNYTVSDKELREASPDQRMTIMAHLEACMTAMPNGEVAMTRQRLQEFERQHGMSTADMRRRVCAGEAIEAEDISSWLITANLYDYLASVSE